MVEARRALLEEACATLPGAVLELRAYSGEAGPDEVEPRDLISAGIPNQVLLERLHGIFGPRIGHMDFAGPALTGEAALKAEALVRETLDRYGLVGPFGLLLTGRSMVSASMILFDTADAEQVETTRNAVREMYDRAAEWGCTGYRAHVSLVDHVAAKFDFNDHALGKTYARLKQAFDPAGILSPGNHGIWPAGQSSRDG
jgi:4-cresol dehydrogenase (hydroxylating)